VRALEGCGAVISGVQLVITPIDGRPAMSLGFTFPKNQKVKTAKQILLEVLANYSQSFPISSDNGWKFATNDDELLKGRKSLRSTCKQMITRKIAIIL
jgi:hypothetical protein